MSNTQPPVNPAHEREQALFILAAAKPGAERAAFLERECGGDQPLRARLEALLAAHEAPESIIDAPAAIPTMKVDMTNAPDETVGQKIGRYKILEKVGEGGCGVVYVAEQTEPVRRRVALKVIKLGMDTKAVVARFEAERQALAMMDHPNIAKVLDAGSTEAGRPYFVMELVRGIKFTDYCDQNKLSTGERLGLFIQVCHAIQHAHQKGIIHRDIKPSNILVTLHDGVPVPKVIDFGIAKATEGRLTEHTVYTQLHQFIGTPAYMSPEQAEMSGLDVDTRSDIYSLGVLLYELLAGRTPFDATELMSLGIDAMRKTIREKEPMRPSTRFATLEGEELTTTAKRRSVDSAKLIHQLKGDLDWIVMKCLEKDRTRRYETANGLASDLKRHLANEAVVARPQSAAYRFQKMVRRNKVAFAAAAAVFTALCLGIIATTLQSVRAHREAVHANEESLRANQEAAHATAALDELRDTAPTFAEQARALAVKGDFTNAIEKLDYAIKLRPDVADYLVAKGDLLLCQLKLTEAAPIYREALRAQPGSAAAGAAAKLCDDVLAAPRPEQGRFTLESLFKIQAALELRGRSEAELKPAEDSYADEKLVLLKSWQARLEALPMFAGIKLVQSDPKQQKAEVLDTAVGQVKALMPLRENLDIGKDGQLKLLLGDLNISDLSALKGLPIVEIHLQGCSNITDVAALAEIPTLKNIIVPVGATNIEALRKLPKLQRLGFTASPRNNLDITNLLPLDLATLDENFVKIQNPTKEQARVEEAYARTYNRLTELGLNGSPQTGVPTTTAEEFWKEYPTLGWIDRLREKASRDLSRHVRRLEDGAWSVNLDGLNTGDLTLLRGARITQLRCDNVPVSDLSPLRGMALKELYIGKTAVADLEPVRGMPITALSIYDTKITDLRPLAGMALTYLHMSGTKVSDISVLRGMPLEDLSLHYCSELTDLSPLADCRELARLTLPPDVTNIKFLHALPKLEYLDFVPDRSGNNANKTAAEFWEEYDGTDAWMSKLRALGVDMQKIQKLADGTWDLNLERQPIGDLAVLRGVPISRLILNNTTVSDLSPLRGGALRTLMLNDTKVTDLAPLAGMRIENLEIMNTEVSDLSPLRGMPLQTLQIGGTAVADLEPLRGMKLTSLWIFSTKVTDLSPLAGMPLDHLHLSGTAIKDISIVRGMPLVFLRMHNCADLTDLSPLSDCKELTEVTLPPNAKNIEFLRAFRNLDRLSFTEDQSSYKPDKTAEQFWQEYDAKNKAAGQQP